MALCQTVTFLRQHGIVHFDAHFGNVLTDGDEYYLADFGLALDGTFELTATERRFLIGTSTTTTEPSSGAWAA